MKKGLAGIITFALLIVLVLIFTAVILTFFKSLMQKQESMTETINGLYQADLHVLNGLPSLALDTRQENPSLSFGVLRKDQENDVAGVRFLFEDKDGESYVYDTYLDPPNTLGVIKEYQVSPEEINAADFSKIRKVSISLLYEQGKATEILDDEVLE